MEIEIKMWLFDILKAIDEIDSFMGTDQKFDSFKSDIKTKRAVERNIEIIGEAMSRIIIKDSAIDLPNSRKIVDTRNRIIYGYDSVSEEIIWNIITEHLPSLKKEIEKLLK